jgi:hypothetical protein
LATKSVYLYGLFVFLHSFTLNKISEKKVGGGFQKRTFINVQNRKGAREFLQKGYQNHGSLDNAANPDQLFHGWLHNIFT